jgi:hypothetical protein
LAKIERKSSVDEKQTMRPVAIILAAALMALVVNNNLKLTPWMADWTGNIAEKAKFRGKKNKMVAYDEDRSDEDRFLLNNTFEWLYTNDEEWPDTINYTFLRAELEERFNGTYRLLLDEEWDLSTTNLSFISLEHASPMDSYPPPRRIPGPWQGSPMPRSLRPYSALQCPHRSFLRKHVCDNCDTNKASWMFSLKRDWVDVNDVYYKRLEENGYRWFEAIDKITKEPLCYSLHTSWLYKCIMNRNFCFLYGMHCTSVHNSLTGHIKNSECRYYTKDFGHPYKTAVRALNF